MKRKLALGFGLVLVALVGTAIAVAQTETPAGGGTTAPATTPAPATPAAAAQPPVTALPPAKAGLDFKLAALSSETFVMVKDQGDYQTVIVYKVSPTGKVQQTDRRNFFYQAP
ncbi:MAG: hypothetical protein HYY84_16315 [Deltaproteobacteria bacterium]|nr:hypothetical protein [Deltaproteobacteria bacterium]